MDNRRVEYTDPQTGELVDVSYDEFLKAQYTDPLLGSALLDPEGREVLNPVPIAPPVGWKKQKTMVDVMREMIKGEQLKAAAEAAGAETFDEADDFEVEDDNDPKSPYEGEYEPFRNIRFKAAQAAAAAKASFESELEGLPPAQQSELIQKRRMEREAPEPRPSSGKEVDNNSPPEPLARAEPAPKGQRAPRSDRG